MTREHTPQELLTEWLRRQLSAKAMAWLDDQLAKIGSDGSDRELHIALGMAPRRLGREDLALTADDLKAAKAARRGWDPRGWSVDDAARILLLCRADGDDEQFAARFTDLCRSADVAEAVALYRGLPLYPAPERLEAQAAEGVRSNMRAMFEAVAHHSPYPREQFDENRWNQMVVKALFIGSTLHPMQGLDARANPALARILCDYAHERWAAGRQITPELWRCVGPYASGAALDDLRRVVETGTEVERKAAGLALSASDDPAAQQLLASMPEIATDIVGGRLTWDILVGEG
jgi:hypothetical protein